PRLQEVESLLGFGSGEREVAGVVAPAHLRREDRPDQRQDPDRQDSPSVRVAPPCKSLQHGLPPLRGRISKGTNRSVANFPLYESFPRGVRPFTKGSLPLVRSRAAW